MNLNHCILIILISAVVLISISGCIKQEGQSSKDNFSSDANLCKNAETPYHKHKPAKITKCVSCVPDANLCEHTETGWACVLTKDAPDYNSPEEYYKRQPEFDKLNENFKQICKEQGGRLIRSAFSWVDDPRFCDFPFIDFGKECANSEECMGYCTVDANYVEKNYPNRVKYEDINCTDLCKGNCSEYSLACNWFEVNNGVIEDYTGVYCELTTE